MAFTLSFPLRIKPPFKSDIHPTITSLYLAILKPTATLYQDGSTAEKVPYTIRKSLLEPGTYIVDPGSFCLRPVEELEQEARRKKDSEWRQKRIKALKR